MRIREGFAGATRSHAALRSLIAAVALAAAILFVLAGNAYASPDKDGDGIPNSADTCLKVANSDQGDLDGDGRGNVCDPDQDGDGVANASDRCPEEPGWSLTAVVPRHHLPPPREYGWVRGG